jgi:hypothetical protein
VKAQPTKAQPELWQSGFDNFDHASMPPYAQPAFANTYAKGGAVGKKAAVRAVHAHERIMHGSKKSELTPIQKLAAGGSVAVIKAAKANTKRALEASRKEKKLKERMARPDLPLDLAGRSGHFAQ